MDPQLAAIRKARKEQYEAQKATAGAVLTPDTSDRTSATTQVDKAVLPLNSSSQAGREPSSGSRKASSSLTEGMPHDLLNAPISSLLADAPAPPPKRPRTDDHVFRVPAGRTAEIKKLLAQPPPHDVKILSWNIDGLDEVGGPQALMLRTLEVAVAVARHRPAVVLLQEAVPPALDLLSAPQVLGNAYEFVVPKEPPMPYYVAILYDKKLATMVDKKEIQFPTSRMGRQLLSITLDFRGRNAPPLVVCTAHLESTKEFAAERKKQLAVCFRYLQLHGAAVLAGDLNIRDEEVKAVQKDLGTQATHIADAWSFCGAPEQHKWTWDTVANDNMAAPFRCKCRFDRMFFISPGISDKPTTPRKLFAAAKPVQALPTDSQLIGLAWRPLSFCLIGKERVPDLGRFPSDHWGLLTSWDVHTGKSLEAEPVAASVAASKHMEEACASNQKTHIERPLEETLEDEDADLKAAIALSMGAVAIATFPTLSTSQSVIDLDA